MKTVCLTLLVLLATSTSFADSFFGAEFTFTNNEIYTKGLEAGAIVNSPSAVKAQEELVEEFTKECLAIGKCIIEEVKNSYGATCYKVTFPEKDNFWVQISTDPSVIEIQSKASTAKEFEAAQPILDELFTKAKKIGVAPHLGGGGGGHIHMDYASTFGDDARLFRNFLVDFMNNPELAGAGVLGADSSNAPATTLLEDWQKLQLKSIIEDFDAGKIKTAKALAEKVNDFVYLKTPADWNPPQKYQALNLTRMKYKDGVSTVEFRGISPQRSPEEFLKQIKLFEARVEMLKKKEGVVRLLDLDNMSEKMKISSFRAYVEESGLEWKNYIPLVRNNTQLATQSIKPTSRLELVATSAVVKNNGCMKAMRKFLNLFR